MFKQSFENVKIKSVRARKRGRCLAAKNAQGERILMDAFGTDPSQVPDGTNAYLFGNSLIMVTRWSNMSAREKRTVETGPICLAIHPCQYVQFSIRVGDNWGDVFTTLYHCYGELNDENSPVKELILIFADTRNPKYVISRSVTLPPYVQKFLQKCNANSHKALALDSQKALMQTEAKLDGFRDFWDVLYDRNWDESKSSSREAKRHEPDDIPNGIYIEISSADEISDMYLNEAKPKQEPMSKEVQLYLQLAEKGIDEGQYNLGVCYETGDGVKQNLEKAVFWYKKAADQGYPKAQYNLGICLYNGYGTAANHKEAARLFLLAANKGHMNSQYSMGVCCYMGHGVEKDEAAAIKWLQKAAAQGHPEAIRFLSDE